MKEFPDNFVAAGRSRRSDKRNAKRSRTRKRLLIALAVILALAVVGAYAWTRNLESKMALKPHEAKAVAKVVKQPKPDEAINILLVGTDSRTANGFARADSIMLLRVDPKKNLAYLVSIPRDTRVEIPGRGMDKINHAWAFGNAPLLIRSVDGFLDMDIHYFFKVDFVSFAKIVDSLGGVQFAVDRGWYDGELGVQVSAGDRRRGGKEALALVRNRHEFGGGDFARMQNQQAFLMAISRQVGSSYASMPSVASTVASYSKTNMDTSTMLKVGQALRAAQDTLQKGRVPIRGTMIRGVYYGLPDEEVTRQIVEAMKNGQPLPAAAQQ